MQYYGSFLFWTCSPIEPIKCNAVVFTDATLAAGLSHSHSAVPEQDQLLAMTGGAAATDYDNDGWVDLYITRLNDTDILYRNLGNGSFQDVSASAGFTQSFNTNGATWADIDNDGDKDLYVTTISDTVSRNLLYINDGKGNFSEEAILRGADLSVSSPNLSNGFSSTFGDYDGDGYLDLFTTEWGAVSGAGNSRLLRNLGHSNPGRFEDVTIAAGVDVSVGHPFGNSYSFAPTFSDVDRDGHTDLIVAGDFGGSKLYWNNGDGTFTDGTSNAGVGTDENGMGSALGDYDGDGDLDWFVTSIYDPDNTCDTTYCTWGHSGNRLYQNNGDRTFNDVTDTTGVRDGAWGWGADFIDYDNDGDLDLTHTNGIDFTNEPLVAQYVNDPTRFWENEGGIFTDVSTQVGVTDNDLGKGLLTFDYDKDGDLDLFIVNTFDQPVLYRNDGGNSNDWLRVKTVGTVSNTDGIGAKVTVIPNLSNPSEILYQEVRAGSNFLGQSDILLHYGLGNASETIDQVIVRWPISGIIQIFEDVSPNSLLLVEEPQTADWNLDGEVNSIDLLIWQDNYRMTDATHSDGDANNDGVVNGADFLIWHHQYLSPLLPSADWNRDGEVNQADLLIWQGNFGMTAASYSDGDANYDSVVNGADFLVWQRQKEITALSTLELKVVPEPEGIVLIVLSYLVLCFVETFHSGLLRSIAKGKFDSRSATILSSQSKHQHN